MRPHFFIITPSFNRASRLRRTIQSVQAQAYEHFDHFVIDDGSTDDTQDVFREFEGTPRLHLHRFQENQGANAARNFLLERILERQEPGFIAILDDDDAYLKDALSNVADEIERHPDDLWFVGECQDQEGRPLCRISPHGRLCFVRDHKLGNRMKGEVAHFFHTSLVEDTRYPDSDMFRNAEEWWFYAEIAIRSPIQALDLRVTEMEYLAEGLTRSQPNRDQALEVYAGKLERFDWALNRRQRAELQARLGRHRILRGAVLEGYADLFRAFKSWPFEHRVYQYALRFSPRVLRGGLSRDVAR